MKIIAHILYIIALFIYIEIYYRYVDIRDREIVIYTIRYILRDVLDILILSYIQCINVNIYI